MMSPKRSTSCAARTLADVPATGKAGIMKTCRADRTPSRRSMHDASDRRRCCRKRQSAQLEPKMQIASNKGGRRAWTKRPLAGNVAKPDGEAPGAEASRGALGVGGAPMRGDRSGAEGGQSARLRPPVWQSRWHCDCGQTTRVSLPTNRKASATQRPMQRSCPAIRASCCADSGSHLHASSSCRMHGSSPEGLLDARSVCPLTGSGSVSNGRTG
mmetsp:Transcript_128098/g.410584  ORF Transcript_128098/g.410584 Transcript_128098/m.410584 type:complete len:214 (+) Transcript_128098:2104-2745(+)